jgi:hypothetical protein
MSKLIIQQWLDKVDYDAWTNQCKHEFENNLIKSVRYRGLKLQASTTKNIMFKTIETVEGSDGTVNEQGIEILLENEDDGVWRIVQERILSEDEVKYDKLDD